MGRAAAGAPGGGRRPVRVVLGGVLTALLVLTGCASIPTSGPVVAGSWPEPLEDPGYRVEPLGPAPRAGPADVVRGFLLAGIGVDDDFSVAREFLAAAQRGSWRPTAETVVHATGGLDVVASPPAPDGSVQVVAAAPRTASVDEHGTYTAAGPGAVVRLDLRLVPEHGQWRITNAPDLLLLDEPDFSRTFRAQPLYFPERASGRLVPDTRWLLDRQSTATTVVDELLAGPSSWLAPAVASGAPSGSSLDPGGSVSVTPEHLAQVDLPASAQRSTPADLAVLRQQLEATLEAVPEVYAVRVTVEGGALPDAGEPDTTGTVPDPAPVVLAGGGLARLHGGALEPVPQLPPLAGLDLAAPAVLGEQYAVLAADRSQLLRLTQGRAGTPPVVLTGTDLTAPSLDRYGWLWSTSAASPGTVTAVSPTGGVAAVDARWLAGRRVVSLRVSGDGARAVVASTGAPGQPDAVRVDVVSVRRQAGGTPQRLTAGPTPPTPWLSSVAQAVWVDDTTVAVLGAPAGASAEARTTSAGAAPQVWFLEAGRPTPLGAPDAGGGPVRLACGGSERSLLVGTADGRLWQRAGSLWAQVAAGGSDPAYAG